MITMTEHLSKRVLDALHKARTGARDADAEKVFADLIGELDPPHPESSPIPPPAHPAPEFHGSHKGKHGSSSSE